MPVKDGMLIGGIATVTLAVSTAFFWPHAVVANGPQSEVKPKLAQPVLRSKGCEITAYVKPESLQAGGVPVIELSARNTTGQTVSLNLQLQLSSSPGPALAMSRVARAPVQSWAGTCPLTLRPGETQSRTISASFATAPVVRALQTPTQIPKPAVRAAPQITLTIRQGADAITLAPAAAASVPPVPVIPQPARTTVLRL